tara:strand:- start:284 stop:619 length:336 start_codon:yes stop_codon:yes gene_type:complete
MSFITATDVRLVKEAVQILINQQKPIALKCLHEDAPLALKHKTIRQFSSVLRVKGEKLVFTDGENEYRMVSWREGMVKIVSLDAFVPADCIIGNIKIRELKKPMNEEPILV